MLNFHYAMQICDTASFQGHERYCGSDRTLLSKKSITSIITTILDLKSKNSETEHELLLLTDNVTDNLKSWLFNLKSFPELKITIREVAKPGIADSIKECYEWLSQNGKNFVYQLQDDYIFQKNCLYDTAAIWFKIQNETGSHCIINPFNDPHYWVELYHNKITPRTLFFGVNSYYIQIYEIGCTFFTSKEQFDQHWDLYTKFFELVRNKSEKLESTSLNYMFVRRAVLGITPMTSLSLHMQTEGERDPYVDWKALWDQIDIDCYQKK